jgi:hypothetical protein
MTRRFNPRHGPRSSIKVQARRLATLARRLAEAFDDPRYDRWDEELDGRIGKALHAGNDALLGRALAVAANLDNPQVFETLRETICNHATSRPVMLATEEVGFAALYAMPVLSVRPGGLNRKRCSIPEQALAALTHSFKACGLVRQDATVVPCAYLFHPEELEVLRFSQVRHLLGELIEHAASVPPHPALTAQTGWPAHEELTSATAPVELRYLLVCVMDQAAAPEPFVLPLSDEVLGDGEGDTDDTDDEGAVFRERKFNEQLDAHLEKVQQWTKQASVVLSDALQPGSAGVLLVQEPQPYYQGLYEGLASFWSLGMMLVFRAHLDLRDMAPRGAWAHIAPVGENGTVQEYRISVLSVMEDELIAGMTRPILAHEDAADVLESLGRTLEDTELLRWTVSREVHEPVACEGCGRALYWTPRGFEHRDAGSATTESDERPDDDSGEGDGWPAPGARVTWH